MPYSPKYIQLDEIPVEQVPDDYDDSEKEDALEFAEASLELDLNDGVTIPSGEFVPMMKAAIKQKATCELVKGAEDPNSSRLGDLADDGTNKTDYANSFCDRYDEIVGKMNQSDEILSTGGNKTNPYVYNTSDPDK